MDNSYLRTEIKGDIKTDPAILEARYRYGMVLLGISILDFGRNRNKDKDEQKENHFSVYKMISILTEAVAPVLLPMITSLGGSEFEG